MNRRRCAAGARAACRALAGLIAVAAAWPAFAVERETVHFSTTYSTVLGQSVYVLGNIPELGNDNAAYAVKLEPGSYPLWQAVVAIPKGTGFTYRYIWRNDSVTQWSNAANQNPIGSSSNATTGPRIPWPAYKGIFYHSTWSQPVLQWRSDSGAYTATSMQAFAPGRSAGETRWRALNVGSAQRRVEFYFTDGAAGRDPASGTYATLLDAFFVQDGQVFDYTPPATVSAPVQTNVSSFYSTNLGENRPYRVLLPRGYTQNTSKHYPVLYMHDGQNVFDMGPYGTWNADETANSMIRGGQMREIIIVAVDNTANRGRNYTAPDDTTPIGPGTGSPGQADKYAAFLINELKPVIDATYRTYPDRDNTATIGSSLGGIVALYLGWDFNSVFGRCGPMSGSWQLPNFPARVLSQPYRDLRIYLDSGDSGTSNDNAWLTMNLRDGLLRKGYALEGDLRHFVGYGQQHNEAAWAARLPRAYEFLFPITEAENPLRAQVYRGDINCDGLVSYADINAFVLALMSEAGYQAQFPSCDRLNADINGDGVVNYADINPFVALLSGK